MSSYDNWHTVDFFTIVNISAVKSKYLYDYFDSLAFKNSAEGTARNLMHLYRILKKPDLHLYASFIFSNDGLNLMYNLRTYVYFTKP